MYSLNDYYFCYKSSFLSGMTYVIAVLILSRHEVLISKQHFEIQLPHELFPCGQGSPIPSIVRLSALGLVSLGLLSQTLTTQKSIKLIFQSNLLFFLRLFIGFFYFLRVMHLFFTFESLQDNLGMANDSLFIPPFLCIISNGAMILNYSDIIYRWRNV